MTADRSQIWRKSTFSASGGECIEVSDPRWRKSSASDSSGGCVEVADDDDTIYVRDSKDPAGPQLGFTRAEMRAWVLGCKAGEFDDLT